MVNVEPALSSWLGPPPPLGLNPPATPEQVGGSIEVIVTSAVVADAGDTWICAVWPHPPYIRPGTVTVPTPLAATMRPPSCIDQVPTKFVRLAEVVVVTGTVVVVTVV